MATKYNPNAEKNPNCAACKVGWPIHQDDETGGKFHIDLFATKEHGIIVHCPTPLWLNNENEEEEEEVQPPKEQP